MTIAHSVSYATITILAENFHAICIADVFPVACGHALIIRRRQVADIFELNDDEFPDLIRLILDIKQRLQREYCPGDLNVGINIGEIAGQTVLHACFHLILRFASDGQDPTGGVRNIIPSQERY